MRTPCRNNLGHQAEESTALLWPFLQALSTGQRLIACNLTNRYLVSDSGNDGTSYESERSARLRVYVLHSFLTTHSLN